MRNSWFVFVVGFMLLMGCSPSVEKSLSRERVERTYQTAMGDLAAGRMEEAFTGFEQVVRSDPGNASARFQLASLLQDYRKDYLGAIGAYREYVRLAPKSDKAKVALERSVICERLLAPELAKKMNLLETAGLIQENEHLKATLKKHEAEVAQLKQEVANRQAALEAMRKEAFRIRQMVATVTNENEVVEAPVLARARALLDEEGEEMDTERRKRELEVAHLIAEEQEEMATPFAVKPVSPSPPKTLSEAEKRAAQRPATYVVCEGDTLYQLAVRFYGTSAAWKRIRDANKTLVTTDGRIRAGMELVLPQ